MNNSMNKQYLLIAIIMKKSTNSTIFALIIIAMFSVFASCSKAFKDNSELDSLNNGFPIGGTHCTNPYSLRIMQAALDSLLATKSMVGSTYILEPTDYYVRISSLDTTAIASLRNMDIELFDYPLDCEFAENSVYYYDPEEPDNSTNIWHYTAVSPKLAKEEVPYEKVLEAENHGELLSIELTTDAHYELSCDLIDECYVPDHDMGTKSHTPLPVSPDELENMAFIIAGVPHNSSMTKASSVIPCGHVYLDNAGAKMPVKGVKIRVQRYIKWDTTNTNDYGFFYVTNKYTNPNISIIYSNQKDFTIWGKWAFVAPTSITVFNCKNANSFEKTFYNSDPTPWSWAVVNNAAYDYYSNCTSIGKLKDVSIPPSNMKLWCVNLDLGIVAGGTPMMKHLITSRVLSGTNAVLAYLTHIGLGRWVPVTIAAVINVFGPDILINTYNKSYNSLYATTFHELSHSSHFNAIGEWNYGKIIWYEMTHGDSTDYYGKGGTGTDEEGYSEVSETYAYSIENYIRKTILKEYKPSAGEDTHYFFNKYVTTLSDLLINGVLTPGEVYGCMTKNTKSMDSLLSSICSKYPSKEATIKTEMSKNGL